MYDQTNVANIGKTQKSQITEQLEIQSKIIDELHAVLSTLEENLKQVSRTLPKSISNEKPSEQLVPMAETLRNNNSRLAHGIDRVKDFISELEL